jgi:hypothetical protein
VLTTTGSENPQAEVVGEPVHAISKTTNYPQAKDGDFQESI